MPVTIIEYAVRVKGTQMYLPRPQRRDGRGGSWYEPMDFSLPAHQRGGSSHFARNMQIRTFSEERAAKIFLKTWLKGRHYGDEDGDTWVRKRSDRIPENMEIVKLTIVLPD